jgi:hypothetical protein
MTYFKDPETASAMPCCTRGRWRLSEAHSAVSDKRTGDLMPVMTKRPDRTRRIGAVS